MKRILAGLGAALLLAACEDRSDSIWEDAKVALIPEEVPGTFVVSTSNHLYNGDYTTDFGWSFAQRIDVMNFEGAGFRTIGTVSSGGVFTLDSSLRCR